MSFPKSSGNEDLTHFYVSVMKPLDPWTYRSIYNPYKTSSSITYNILTIFVCNFLFGLVKTPGSNSTNQQDHVHHCTRPCCFVIVSGEILRSTEKRWTYCARKNLTTHKQSANGSQMLAAIKAAPSHQ